MTVLTDEMNITMELRSIVESLENLAGNESDENINDSMIILQRIFSPDFPPQELKVALSLGSKIISSSKGKFLEKIGDFFLRELKNLTINVEEYEFLVRNTIFNKLVSEHGFDEAAQFLGSMTFSSNSLIPANMRADCFIKCAECALQYSGLSEADAYLNRASSIMIDVNDPIIQLRYRVSLAQVLDLKRNFLEAASKYYEVSCVINQDISENELLLLLGKAVTCIILCRPSPQRSRVVQIISNDSRMSKLSLVPHYTSHGTILSKIAKVQLLTESDLGTFSESLAPHQNIVASDGWTILFRSMLEHNLAAVSRIYENIHFEELGNLLGISASVTEKIVAKMIAEKRLSGSIDQRDDLLSFDPVLQTNTSIWNETIASICHQVSCCGEDAKSLLCGDC